VRVYTEARDARAGEKLSAAARDWVMR